MNSVMEVMDPSGHTEVKWDPNNSTEVEVARATFEMMTEEKGYNAFRIRRGQKDERMRTFDPTAEKMMLIPHMVGG